MAKAASNKNAHPARPVYLGLDMGGTKMMMCAVTPEFKILSRVRIKTKANRGTREGVPRMIQGLHDALAEVPRAKLLGIATGCPGPIDAKSGSLKYLPNLKWRNVPLVALLEKEFKVPVTLNNDVDMGTYGEFRLGVARDYKNIIGIFPGTGIGGAVIVDGRLVRGASGYAGEVGHMTVMAGGPLCGCGKFGCLEAFSGRLAVARQAATAAIRGEAPSLLARSGTDVTRIKSTDLAEAIEDGDRAIEQIVRQSARLIGYVASDIVNLLNPELIVLGGGLVEAMKKIYLEEVRAGIAERALSQSKGVKVKTAQLGDDAVVLGAVFDFVEKFGKEEKKSGQ